MNIARISPVASEQVSEIWDYLEEVKNGLGDEFFTEFATTVQVIERHPSAFQLINPAIRRAILKKFKYSIFYHYHPDPFALDIIEVIHQSSNPDEWPTR